MEFLIARQNQALAMAKPAPRRPSATTDPNSGSTQPAGLRGFGAAPPAAVASRIAVMISARPMLKMPRMPSAVP
jgi:hypothetical protein